MTPPRTEGSRSAWARWTAPHPALTDPAERRTARLLASLLLALMLVGGTVATAQLALRDDFQGPFLLIVGGLGLLAVGYALARSRQHRLAVYLAAAVPVIASTAVGATTPDDPAWFAFATLGVVIATAFLPTRAVAVVAATTGLAAAGVVVLAWPALPLARGLPMLGFVAVLGLLAVMVRWHREGVERDRDEALRESVHRYRTLVNTAPVGIGVATTSGRVIEANAALQQLLGRDASAFAAIGSVAALYADPADRTRLLALLARDGRVLREAVELRHGDGTTLPAELSLVPFQVDGEPGTLAIIEDLRDRRRLQSELLQAQKVESIGRLAGGIAHDFNNLLTVIRANLDLALLDLGDHPVVAELEEAQRATRSAAAVTQQLLAFSRRQVIAPRVLYVDDVVRDVERLLRRLLGEQVQLVIALAPTTGLVRADATQLEQVLVNLAANARDAMPTGGRLTIATADGTDGATGRPNVRLTVADTGTGMTEEVRAHLFEPFYTTKVPGAGTGLGLASVAGAIAQMGGQIHVDTAPGRGTVFTIALPCVEGAVESPPIGESDAAPTGRETVLVVEDEASVRQTACRMLARLGYTVLSAGDGESALALAASHDGPIDLVLSDVIMPGMDGRTVAGRIEALRPGVRVLLTSGYTADVLAPHGAFESGLAFLPKPYSAAMLARRVRDVLDGAA